MPVVTVAAPPHPAVGILLRAVADVLAETLDLGTGDVVVSHVPTGASAASGTAAAATWAVIAVHGSDRGRERMAFALRAVEAVARGWSIDHDAGWEGVWTQWLLPTP